MSEESSLNFEQTAPQQFYEQDAQSNLTLGTLSKTKTETYESLYGKGIEGQTPKADVNYPHNVHDPIFPEEFTMETDTGLVKVETLQSLGRRTTNRRTSDCRASLSDDASWEKPLETPPGELNPDIELVTFKINDPENPLNWSFKSRLIYTFILTLLVIQAAYGSASLAGGLPVISKKFGVSDEVSTLSVSLNVLGFMAGIGWAPLSEQIGRKPVYIISFIIYVIFNIPVALAKNIGTVLVCRFLCGVFSSSALVLVAASICDIHDTYRGFFIAGFSWAPYSAPCIGAIVNGFISVDTGRYDLMPWVNMAFAGVLLILICFVPETYAPVILKHRAKKLRQETGNANIMTEQEAQPMSFSELMNDVVYRPFKFIVQEPVLVLVCLFIALIYGMVYAFFFAFPTIFGELYGYQLDKVGLMYIPILIGATIAVGFTVILENRYNVMKTKRSAEPEDRLVGAMFGAPGPVIAMFILGATSYKHIIWVGPASAGIPFGFGMVLLYYSLNNYILDVYKFAASALGTKVFIRSSAGAAFPLFVTQMYTNLGLQWASWLLAFICLGMMFIPFIFYKFGKQLRTKLCRPENMK